MNNQKLNQILKKYLPLGIIWGSEFLMTPDVAKKYLNDLTKLGIKIYGCDLWRFLDPDKNPTRIVELLGAGILVNTTENNLIEINSQVMDFLLYNLPDDADLISFIYQENEIYEFFRSQKRST